MRRPSQIRRAFTLLELLTTMAIIAILAVLLLPALQQAHSKARRVACGSNLKNVGAAFHAWAHDHNDLFPMQVSTNQGGTREFAETAGLNPDVSFTFRHFQAVSNELILPKPLVCPADRQRVAASHFASLRNENVSYWINSGTAFGHTDSPIAGDRNVRTSGRTEWTFIRFGLADVVEFSPELFADAHVDVLDGVALRLAFASSNAVDVTLSIPRPEIAQTGLNNNPGPGGGNGGGSSPDVPSSPSSLENASSTGGRPGAMADASRGKSNAFFSPDPAGRARPLAPGDGVRETFMVVTRLDGTVVTSSVPYKVSLADNGKSVAMPRDATNPFIEFVRWLTQLQHAAHTGCCFFCLWH
jgi:prepilin-type N-terminal cleavage/methylation domain-containing protein